MQRVSIFSAFRYFPRSHDALNCFIFSLIREYFLLLFEMLIHVSKRQFEFDNRMFPIDLNYILDGLGVGVTLK
jgi:hypothetical protein